MSDRVFLDTNVVIYGHTNLDPVKQVIAQGLISIPFAFISTQVLQETANTLSKKLKKEWPDVQTVINELVSASTIYRNSETTILKAVSIAGKYKYSFYDSLIISAALECGCSVLYSEDMHDGQVIDNALTIINPFKND
jgi:predicted nucleic acid-binding protein